MKPYILKTETEANHKANYKPAGIAVECIRQQLVPKPHTARRELLESWQAAGQSASPAAEARRKAADTVTPRLVGRIAGGGMGEGSRNCWYT